MAARPRLYRHLADLAHGRGRHGGFAAFRLVTPILALILLLAPGPPATALTLDRLPPLTQMRQQSARVSQAAADLDSAATRREADAGLVQDQLARDEATLRARDIRTDMLRAARLELDSATQRSVILEGQAKHQRAGLARLEEAAAALAETSALDRRAGDDLERLRDEAALRLLRDQVAAQGNLVAALERLASVNQRLMGLAGQRLRLLQTRARLDALDGQNLLDADDLPGRDTQTRAIEQVVTGALRTASRLADEVALVQGQDPASVARRQGLEAGILEAGTRAYLAQNSLELLDFQRRLTGLAGLREDPSMPVALLRDAAQRLVEIEDTLHDYQRELAGQRRMLAARRALAGGTADSGAPNPDLGHEIARQEAEVADLLRLAADEARRFDTVAAEIYSQSLTDRHSFPTTRGEWHRVATGAAGLPGLLARELGFVAQDLRTRTAALTPADWAALAGGLLAITAGTFWVRGAMRRHLVGPGRWHHLSAPAGALAETLPLALPAALWAWVGTRIDLPRPEFLPIVLLFAIAPLCIFGLLLARAVLFGPAPAARPPQASTAFYRRLRWGLLLAAIIAALYLITSALPVSPLLGDVLDRLAMLGLLPLAVPAFGLHRLICGPPPADQPETEPPAAPSSEAVSEAAPEVRSAAAPDLALPPGLVPAEQRVPPATPQPRLGPRLLAELARLVGVALITAGLLGLLGYANLAWTISSRLAWLSLVATLLYFAIGTLGDLRNRLARRFASEEGEFWRRQFLVPGHGLAVLLAWLAAGWTLVHLWGLSTETPAIRAVLDWAARPLFTSGKLTLTPWHLALAVLLAALALTSGTWVRRVSYQLAFARVRDRGLRLALSSLTQYLAVLFGVVLALMIAGFDLTTLLVFVASLGVGIGFGLQNTVNNFISGVLILVERPLRVGDLVTVGGHEGEVTHIGFRSLTLRSFDKQEVIIPNGTLINDNFINWTRSDDVLRTVLTVGIGYQEDPDRAMALVRDILAGYDAVLRTPSPIVSLWEFADSAVVLRIEYCIHVLGTVRRTEVRSEVNRRIWYGFQAAGISIPFPQRDLHVRMISSPEGADGSSPASG